MKLYQLVSQARLLAPSRMPKMQKAVFTCLVSHSNKNGDGTQIFPGIKRIALECSCSERSVQRCLNWLEAEGWIVALYKKGGYGRPSGYTLNLDQFGWLEARPPAPAEPKEMEPEERLTFVARRLTFARGVLRRLKPDSPARPRWEDEIAELEQELGQVETPYSYMVINDQAAHLPEPPEAVRPRYLPAAINHQALVGRLTDQEFYQLEEAYFGSIAAQARSGRDSPEWNKWVQFIAPLRDSYNKALHERGIVASDGHDPPMDQELEEQIQEDQHNQWAEEQRLRAQIEERTTRRDTFSPGTVSWRMWNALINQTINTLKTDFFYEGG